MTNNWPIIVTAAPKSHKRPILNCTLTRGGLLSSISDHDPFGSAQPPRLAGLQQPAVPRTARAGFVQLPQIKENWMTFFEPISLLEIRCLGVQARIFSCVRRFALIFEQAGNIRKAKIVSNQNRCCDHF
jgi:hypothetical protein